MYRLFFALIITPLLIADEMVYPVDDQPSGCTSCQLALQDRNERALQHDPNNKQCECLKCLSARGFSGGGDAGGYAFVGGGGVGLGYPFFNDKDHDTSNLNIALICETCDEPPGIPVPEPTSLTLLTVAAGAALLRRKRLQHR